MRRTSGIWAVLGALAGLLAIGCASDPPTKMNAGPTESSPPATGAAGVDAQAAAGAGSSAGNGSAAGSSSAAAGSPSSAGTSGSAAKGVDCAALPLTTNADDIISTFEDGTGSVMQVAGRGGGFYMFNDMTGKQTPAPGPLPDAKAVTRCESKFALCMSGSGFMTWGAGMGTDFAPTTAAAGGVATKMTYDASRYSGVSFWAKSASAAVSVRVSFKDKNTAPEGGQCDAMATSGATACNDDWGKGLNLATDWKPYTITFAELRQAGWGKASSAFDIKNVYSIQLQVNQGIDFDLCIDDVAFVH